MLMLEIQSMKTGGATIRKGEPQIITFAIKKYGTVFVHIIFL
jgi:hypothetical protein